MSRTCASVLAFLFALPFYGATAKKQQTAGKTSTASTKKAAPKRTASAARKGAAKKAAPRRTAQSQPTPERYREIQDALAQRGYLASERRGSWDDNSAAALRQFQQDQNLQPTGKIDSLSLIALGLGPRRSAPQRSQP